MGQALLRTRFSEDDYLAAESLAEAKHEYVAGEVYAMAGASERHNRIAGNIFFHLRAATRGKGCRVFMSDMKLKLVDSSAFYYPDVMLACDSADDHPLYKSSPCFIAEVLSVSTAAVDLREKLVNYRRLDSLRYYLLVDSERAWAKLYFREPGGDWYEQEISADDVVPIRCGDMSAALSWDDFFEDTGLLTGV